ncbi:MAG: membrane protein insertase YidC [Bacteroidales bacterium]|nr:membrane protein insertase YidC [Bacteroidales bacterium]
MDKNSIIGFVLIALIMMGFFGYQSRQVRKQQEYQAQLDSIAAAEAYAQYQLDSAWRAEHPEAAAAADSAAHVAVVPVAPVYSDSLLNMAARAEEQLITLENSKLQIAFTTRGAQPYSVLVKDYLTYSKEPLYLLQGGKSELGYVVYAPTAIDTRKFTFQYVPEASSDSTVVMRLPFGAGGYIEQKYVLEKDSYSVKETVSFVGMGSLIPHNVRSIDVDFDATIPRMEKGYKNETQYSRLNYYFPDDNKPENIGNGRKGEKRFNNNIEWFAFQQQFFSAIMRAPENFSYGEFAIDFLPKGGADLMHCSAQMRADINAISDHIEVPFEFYFGPNNYKGLKAYGHAYEKVIPLGGRVIGYFTKWVIIPLFDWLHKFISNFGLIILLMTIFIKIVVLPFAYKSYSSSAKMQALKPYMDKINAKYPKQEDAMKKQQETMDLYRKAGVSPMGGCLPMLLQMPILWAMFRFFPASIELRQQPFLWAEDLSAYDDVIHWGTSILGMDHISLFALLMALSMFFYSKITMQQQNAGNDPNAKMMQAMSLYMMPIMMFFICNNLSSGLSYYYLLSNLITMVETWVIRKWVVNPQDVLNKVKAAEASGKSAPKSKWQQRLEEAQKMQREMEKQQQKKGRK